MKKRIYHGTTLTEEQARQGYNQGPTPWPEPHAVIIDKEGKATKVHHRQASPPSPGETGVHGA